jgi:hypothetical protein
VGKSCIEVESFLLLCNVVLSFIGYNCKAEWHAGDVIWWTHQCICQYSWLCARDTDPCTCTWAHSSWTTPDS